MIKCENISRSEGGTRGAVCEGRIKAVYVFFVFFFLPP
jgi:hypothetical protein